MHEDFFTKGTNLRKEILLQIGSFFYESDNTIKMIIKKKNMK